MFLAIPLLALYFMWKEFLNILIVKLKTRHEHLLLSTINCKLYVGQLIVCCSNAPFHATNSFVENFSFYRGIPLLLVNISFF